MWKSVPMVALGVSPLRVVPRMGNQSTSDAPNVHLWNDTYYFGTPQYGLEQWNMLACTSAIVWMCGIIRNQRTPLTLSIQWTASLEPFSVIPQQYRALNILHICWHSCISLCLHRRLRCTVWHVGWLVLCGLPTACSLQLFWLLALWLARILTILLQGVSKGEKCQMSTHYKCPLLIASALSSQA